MYLRKIFILTFLIGIVQIGLSQKKLPAQISGSDTNTVNNLLLVSKNNLATDLDKAIEFGNQARDLARKINFKKGEALALKYIGIGYFYQGKNIEALDYYQRSLAIFQSTRDTIGISNIENNIGAIYMNQGDDAKALEYILRSLQMAEKTGDNLRILTSLTNVGAIYSHQDSTLDLAITYNKMALPKAEELNDSNSIGTITANLGEIYLTKKNDSLAIIYLNRSLQAFGNAEGSSFANNTLGKIYLNQGKYNQALQAHQNAYSIARKLDSKVDMVQSLQGIGNTYFEKGEYSVALRYLKEAELTAKAINATLELMKVDFAIAASYAKLGDYQNAHLYDIKYSNYKDTLYNTEKDKKIGKLQFEFDLQKKEGQIDLLKKDNQLSESELKKQKFARNALVIGLFMTFIIAFFIYRNYRLKVKTNKELDRQNLEIEKLILNILPSEVAKELRVNGQATPRNHESVSVLFTDFKGFTKIADRMTPAEVVHELNTCFMAFDNITEKYNLEKIKTIGDSYMCAGGVPTFHENHVIDIVKAGFEMLKFIDQYNEEKIRLGFDVWSVRIGIHVGPVVAGVVGKNKYAYDIWGSTVNIASRMESNGVPGMINISAATYEYLKNDYTCDYRGKISAKNVGEIEMYFVTGEKSLMS